MKCLRKICRVSLKDKIRNEIVLGWRNVARVSNIGQPQEIEVARLECLMRGCQRECCLDIWTALE